MQMKRLFSFLSTMVIVTFMFSLFSTTHVLADDGDTPPVQTEETVQPPTEETAPETQTVPTSTPEGDVLSAEVAPTETPADILASAPEGVDVVVLDGNGDALPLVTEEAAQVILSGDPMWCPDGVLPGGTGCTPAYTDFASLIADLTSGGYAGSGTIYVAYDYSDAEGDISIDHTSGSLSGLDNLVIQGGWNFGTNTLVGNSNLGNNSLSITNWVGNVTVNNIFISGADQTGLTVDTQGQIEVNHVTSNNNDGHGAQLTGGTGVTISNSEFNYNDQDVNSGAESLTLIFSGSGSLPLTGGRGVVAGSGGNITLDHVTANGNGAGGAELVNCFIDISAFDCLNTNPDPANITVSNSEFNGNGETVTGQPSVGLWVGARDNASLSNVVANGNANGSVFGGGALVFSGYGNTSIVNSNFNENCVTDCYSLGFGFLSLTLNGTTTVEHVQANNNGYVGAFALGMNDVNIICSEFNNNAFGGLAVLSSGTITLSGVVAEGNGYGDFETSSPNPIVSNSGCRTADKIESFLPVNVIPTQDGQHELDCQNYSATVLLLPSDDHVRFPCPLRDSAEIKAVSSDALPGALPEKNTFRSGLNVQLFNEGVAQSSASPAITVSFLVPEGADAKSLTILFWNGTEWVDLGGEVSSVGPHGEVVEGQLYFKVTTSHVGTFALVSK